MSVASHTQPRRPRETPGAERASFSELFTPKLITVLREGYDFSAFRADAVAGLTVAIVALPLAMAIAIASGVTPDRGLFTAIVAGFLISALGGSRFQIGGPTGAFVVVVYAVVQHQGYDGLVLATVMAGLMLIAVGFLRLGTYIKYIPYPVVVGFTAGIAVIIFSSQIKDLLGLRTGELPGEFLPKMAALWEALPTLNPATLGITVLSLAIILGLRRWRPKWPGFLIAVAVASPAVFLLDLTVDTIGSRFGGVPRTLPAPSLPSVEFGRLVTLLPDAVTIALLAGIESLLSAVVADGMTGRRHRSNCELVAQGVANVAAAVFGGICATGAIARTATNIRSGARSPVAGMMHAVFLLLFMLVAAPLASYIPLASLGAVLAIVAWNMSEAGHVVRLLSRGPVGDRLTLLTTLLLTVLVDLTVAIQVGVVMAAIMFMHRMAEAVRIETNTVLLQDDTADSDQKGGRKPYSAEEALGAAGFVVFRINGPFFFGAASQLARTLDRIGPRPKGFILDFSAVPLIDSTGAATLTSFVDKARSRDAAVILAAVNPKVRRSLRELGLKPPVIRLAANVSSALAAVSKRADSDEHKTRSALPA